MIAIAGLTVALLGSGCATAGAPRPSQPAAEQTKEATAQAKAGRAQRERDPDEHYRRVMERASRRGIRVIWINPPKQASVSDVSPPQADR